jgi:hypothetical protein
MSTFYWWFNTIPDPKAIAQFYDNQIPLFARNVKYLTGADGQPFVDDFLVTHDNGVKNIQFELNGLPGHSGDTFCFPGYFPGDKDEQGNPLFNVCNTNNFYYQKIVSQVINRAKFFFNMEYTTSDRKFEEYRLIQTYQRHLHPQFHQTP